MAHTVTVLSQTENGAVLEIDEDATAAALVQTDILAALNDGALKDALSVEFADQAAAIAALDALNAGGFATAALNPATPIVSANVSGAGAGNFRLETNVAKAAGTDTARFVVRLGAPHSIVA